MKNLKVITIITLLLVVISATHLLAQGRQAKTGSAKAAYGYPAGEYKAKKKKKKQRKAPKRKAKATPLYRKKNPWAS